MSKSTRHHLFFYVARLISHVRTPLYGNGYALMLSSASNSGLGVVYWILAARTYSTSIVGLNSAAIAAMMFLAGVSQLNLASALTRFIPGAGRATRHFVIYSYVISVGLGAVASLAFILGINAWIPKGNFIDTFIDTVPFFIPWFIIATMAWCVFNLQDSVLTGLRQAIWVPAENALYGVTKIVLLVIFAGLFPRYGVFASWTIALAVSLLPTNALILLKLIPRHMQRAKPEDAMPIAPGPVARFVAPDYVGALCWLMATTLLPVLVTQRVGTTANAYYYLTWTIAYSLYLISPNMGSSLIVEAAIDPRKLSKYSYQAFISTTRLLAPVVAVVVLGAPVILRIFGENYAAEGSTLLRLLALSAMPFAVNALYISVARVQRHMRSVVAVLAALCGLVFALSFALLDIYGITGIGIAWLVSQSVIAAVLWLTRLRTLWSRQPDGGLPPKEVDYRVLQAPVPTVATNGRPVDHSASTLPLAPHVEPHTAGPITAPDGLLDVTVQPIGLMNDSPKLSTQALKHIIPEMASKLHLLSSLGSLRDYGNSLGHLAKSADLIPLILPTIPPQAGVPSPATWVVRRMVPTVTDTTVIMIGPQEQTPKAALKLPKTQYAAASLRQATSVLTSLHGDPRLGEWSALLPRILAQGEIAGQPYVVEQMLPGVEASRLFSDPAHCQQIQATAAAAIGEFHCRTAVSAVVDAKMLKHWIDEPLHLIRRVNATLPNAARNLEAIDRLAIELRQALAGRTLSLSWIHGDFGPGNILVTPDGSRLTGVVDWELSRPDEPPFLDLLQLLIATRMLVQRREMGSIVKELLNDTAWTPHERALLDAAQAELPGDKIDTRTLALLCWLRHVASNLTKSTRYAASWLWVTKNVEFVLRSL
jgi:O-antigen/teichoic acid export membrane protein